MWEGVLITLFALLRIAEHNVRLQKRRDGDGTIGYLHTISLVLLYDTPFGDLLKRFFVGFSEYSKP